MVGVFLRHLVERGLKGVQLIISDACRGLTIRRAPPSTCPKLAGSVAWLHFYRNVFSHVPATKDAQGYSCPGELGRGRPKGARLSRRRPAHRQDEHGGRSRRAERVRNAHLTTPSRHIHWQKIRTNNPLERIMREICRRTLRRWSVPRWPIMPQPGGRATALHRRHRMVHQVLYEHAASLSAATHANRSRRLIKCAKRFWHYQNDFNCAAPGSFHQQPVVLNRLFQRRCDYQVRRGPDAK